MKNSVKIILLILIAAGVFLTIFFSKGKESPSNQNIHSSSMTSIPGATTLTGLQDIIVKGFSEGNVEILSKYFVQDISLNILEEEDFYTVEEAAKVLSDFFDNYPSKEFLLKHTGSNASGKVQYLIGNLTTPTNETFRIYVSTTNDFIEGIEVSKEEGENADSE